MSILADIHMHQLRQVVAKTLEMPREGVACIIIVAENHANECTQRMFALNIDPESITELLNRALIQSLTHEPSQMGRITVSQED